MPVIWLGRWPPALDLKDDSHYGTLMVGATELRRLIRATEVLCVCIRGDLIWRPRTDPPRGRFVNNSRSMPRALYGWEPNWERSQLGPPTRLVHRASILTPFSAQRPNEAIWAPIGYDGCRMRLAGLAGVPHAPESYRRIEETAEHLRRIDDQRRRDYPDRYSEV